MNHEQFFSRANGPLHRGNRASTLYGVAPRHLAGAGDPRHVTEYLLASGWSDHSIAGYPHVLLASPDGRVHLALEPNGPEPRESWWRVYATDQADRWSAQFGGHTPVEIITGFTDALTTLPTAGEDPWEVVRRRGWSRLGGAERAALSPDETALLARVHVPLVSGPTTWRWKAAVFLPAGNGRRWLWGATIDEPGPTRALAGFVNAFTDPTPLIRDEGQTPPYTFGLLTCTPSSRTPEQVRRLHHQRVAEARRQSAASTSTPPRPPNSGQRRRR